ncbi:MAG TPA: extracellular solute-binding protein, partial [Clostridiaceae bacterium]|nr:extracellular solute-binding protein [Clostridiaceae bacterium]
MLRKIIAILLVSTIVFSFCACSSGTTTSKEPDTSQTTQSTGETSEKPITIEVFEGINVTLPTPDKDPILQELQKRLGITLIMNTSLPANDYRNQLNVRIAGGDIPDVFWILSRADLLKHSKDGTILNLTPYIDRLTDVVKFLGEENMKAGYIGDQLYAISKAPNIPYGSYFLRKDWLDNLGLEIPKTLDEFIEVAEKFTYNDPDKNGIQDTIGLSGTSGWGAFAAVFGGYAIGT